MQFLAKVEHEAGGGVGVLQRAAGSTVAQEILRAEDLTAGTLPDNACGQNIAAHARVKGPGVEVI